MADSGDSRSPDAHAFPPAPVARGHSRKDYDGPAVLVIDDQIPQYDRAAGALGMFHYCLLLRELGFRVVFIPADGKRVEPYATTLERSGIDIRCGDFDFVAWIAEVGSHFSLAWLSRPGVAVKYVDAIRDHSDARILYCGRDLQSLRLKRRFAVEGDPRLLERSNAVAATERRLFHAADAILTFSTHEHDIIAETLGSASKIHLIPAYIFDLDDFSGPTVSYEDRTDIVFLGSLPHSPNADGIRWFVDECWPLVTRWIPQPRLVIIGDGMAALGHLQSASIHVVGHASDLAPHFARARLSIAPLRYGAGVKGKIVMSLAFGVPVVTTSVGAEGLGLQDGVHARVADGAEAFAEAIVSCWGNEDRWRTLSANGRDFVGRFYNRERAASTLSGVLAGLGIMAGPPHSVGLAPARPPGGFLQEPSTHNGARSRACEKKPRVPADDRGSPPQQLPRRGNRA